MRVSALLKRKMSKSFNYYLNAKCKLVTTDLLATPPLLLLFHLS